MSENNKEPQKIAEMLNWSAGQMKILAGRTNDPILKVKYEKIAGINRQFCDRCSVNQTAGDRQLIKEIELLKAAQFCQQAVYLRLCTQPVEQTAPITDEIIDAQKTIIRDLFLEMEKREKTL